MSPEFTMDHHDKSSHNIYKVVPKIMCAMLLKYPELGGFAIGGSYANLQYRDGDDIDSDIFFTEYPNLWSRKLGIEKEIRESFKQSNLILYIRWSLQTDLIPVADRVSVYIKYPNTTYVVRNRAVAQAWGLIR